MQSNVHRHTILGTPAEPNLYKWLREADYKPVKPADSTELGKWTWRGKEKSKQRNSTESLALLGNLDKVQQIAPNVDKCKSNTIYLQDLRTKWELPWTLARGG